MNTSENDIQYNNLNMGEMDKSRELYSKEGDNSSKFEGKTVAWEHTIMAICPLLNLKCKTNYFYIAGLLLTRNVKTFYIKGCNTTLCVTLYSWSKTICRAKIECSRWAKQSHCIDTTRLTNECQGILLNSALITHWICCLLVKNKSETIVVSRCWKLHISQNESQNFNIPLRLDWLDFEINCNWIDS